MPASTGKRAAVLVALVLVLAQASRPSGADALDQGALAYPTIAGIQNGVDDALEKALALVR